MYLVIIFPIIVAVFILILFIFALKKYQIVLEEVAAINSETQKLKNRSDALKKGKTLAEDEIDEINKLFSILIPDSEDFFSIIYALEKISQESGFAINKYSINLGSPAEKTSITVDGQGGIDEFMKLLKTYQFAGGRFATSESINFANAKVNSTQIQLNFYSKKGDIDIASEPVIKDSDIDFIRKIKDKIKIEFKENKENNLVEQDYNIKQNPFTYENSSQILSASPSPEIAP